MPPKGANGGAGTSTSPTMNRTLSSFFQKDASKSNAAPSSSSSHAKEKSKQDNPFLESSSSPADAPAMDDGKENIVSTPTKRTRKTNATKLTSESPSKAKKDGTKAKKNNGKAVEAEASDNDSEAVGGNGRTFLLTEVAIPVRKKATPKKKVAMVTESTNDSSSATSVIANVSSDTDTASKGQVTPRKGSKKASKTALKTTPMDTLSISNQDVDMTPASPTPSAAKDRLQDKPDVIASSTNNINSLQQNLPHPGPLFVCKITKVDAMFRVRNGKASITEAKLKFMNHPSAIMDLARFHHFREELQEKPEDQLEETGDARLICDALSGKNRAEIMHIPDEHLGVIAKLIEESELALVDLAEHVARVLAPMDFEGYEHYDLQRAAKLATAAGVTSESTDVENQQPPPPEADQSSSSTIHVRYSTQVSRVAILDAIQKVAHRVNYGIPASNLPISSPVTPANLSIYRWETKDVDQYFTKELKSAVTARRERRMEASAALLAWFLGLDLRQQQELCPVSSLTANLAQIIGGAGTSLGGSAVNANGGVGMAAKRKRTSFSEGMEIEEDMSTLTKMAKACDNNVPTSVAEMNALLQQPSTVAAMVDPAILEAKLKAAEAKKKESELKEERRRERDLKEAERQQKEEAKKRREEEDRLRKEQTAQRFVGFFKQAQPPQAKKTAQQQEADHIKQSNPSLASFLDLFQPFHVKANATVAPINRFARPVCTDFEQLVLSSTDVDLDSNHEDEKDDVPLTLDVKQARQTLQVLFRPRGKLQEGDATADAQDVSSNKQKRMSTAQAAQYRNMTVKELIQSGVLLQDQGEDPESVFNHKNIPALKMRLLQFAENYRPAYYGTWSKRSNKVNGRRILGKDTDLLDYDFDSEAEWEEDEEGEELKSDDDEEEDDMSEQEEEDDWLVPEGYLSEDEGLDQEGEEGGQKERTVKKPQGTRKPLLAQLVPVIVGPIYQETLGVSTHPALEPFQIEFIGDFEMGSSPFAIDPMAMEDVTTTTA